MKTRELCFIYYIALFILSHISFANKPNRVALHASPEARKLQAKYTNLSQGNLIQVRELSGNFALLKLWTPCKYSLAFYRPCSSIKQTPYSKYKDNSEVAFSMIFTGKQES